MESFVFNFLFALSLCADCFAVSLCSSVTLREIKARDVVRVAAAFAIIQSSLMLIGWVFGAFFVGFLDKLAHIIGLVLLVYVGGSMVIEGIRNKVEARNLNGLKNVIIGGIATSIDALAVGVSLSMGDKASDQVISLGVYVFAVTALSVVLGMLGGKTIGSKFGRWAEIAGGCVLLGIAVIMFV